MKCICEGIDLSDAVLKVVKACSSKTTVPVLECIKLNAKTILLSFPQRTGKFQLLKI